MDKFIEYPLSDLVKIPESGGLYELIKNHYWLRTSKGNVLFFGKNFSSPQCNTNESIVKKLVRPEHGYCEVILVENAWVKIDLKDYV